MEKKKINEAKEDIQTEIAYELFSKVANIFGRLQSEEGKKLFSKLAIAQLAQFQENQELTSKSANAQSRVNDVKMIFHYLDKMVEDFEIGRTFEDFEKTFNRIWGKREKGDYYIWVKNKLFFIWEEEEKFAKTKEDGVNV